MNKTKIEIDGIKYYLGLGFLNELVSGTGKQLTEFGGVEDVILIPLLMYYSRLYACKRENLTVNFTQDSIFDYIDEKGGIQGKVVTEFYTAYLVAMTYDVPEEDKKKAKETKK